MKIFHSGCHGIPLSLMYFFVKRYYPKFFTCISECLWISNLHQIVKPTILGCIFLIFLVLWKFDTMYLLSVFLYHILPHVSGSISHYQAKTVFSCVSFYPVVSNLWWLGNLEYVNFIGMWSTYQRSTKENCISSIYQLSITQPIIPYIFWLVLAQNLHILFQFLWILMCTCPVMFRKITV